MPETSRRRRAGTAKIRVEDLRKSFHGKVVLDGVNLSVAEGESLVIVGPSGTGKSVLLKHLIGLVQPDSGRVFVDGQDFWALSDRERTGVRKKFGMSFQEGALFDSMSVFDNVAFPLRRSGRPPAEVRDRVRECLEIVQLPNVEGKRPVGALRGNAAPGRFRPRDRPRARDPPLRRAEHGSRPDHDRRHRRGDPGHEGAAGSLRS